MLNQDLVDRPDSEQWHRAPVYRGFAESQAGVDRASGTLHGFIAMETGVARGHGEEVDAETLDAVVRLTAGRSVKMRFGHPPMSDDAIGTSVGRASNFRRDGNRVLADAVLLQAAKSAPGGDLFSHVLDLAEEAPDMFGTSLVIKRDLAERVDDKGEPLRHADGRRVPPLIRPTAVLASDFVDSPAATPSLFSDSGALLSAEAAQIFDTVLSRPDASRRIQTYIARLDADRPGTAATLRAALTAPPTGDTMPDKPDTEPRKELTHDEMVAQLKAAGYKVGPATPEKSSPDDGAADLKNELAELRAELAADRKARAEAEAKVEAARIKLEAGALKARLAKLTHVDQSLRDQAAEHVETFLAAGQADAAEKLVAAYESMPDVTRLSLLDTKISVPVEGGETRTIDLKRYHQLRDGEDGPEVVLAGDREEMAAAALASELPTAEERRAARMELFKARGKGGAA